MPVLIIIISSASQAYHSSVFIKWEMVLAISILDQSGDKNRLLHVIGQSTH